MKRKFVWLEEDSSVDSGTTRHTVMLSGALEFRVPIRSGNAFRIDSPPENGLVTVELDKELTNVFEIFARDAGFNRRNRVGFSFKPGIFGHHIVGRAADIYAVGGVGIDVWNRRWNTAQQCAANAGDASITESIMMKERRRNLGWRLYKTLHCYGRWSKPVGYPIQLFGPWTRSEGPWKRISDFLLNAHRDHIHVAK